MAWICFAVAVVWAGSCRSDFTSSLGNSICHWCGRKKKKSYFFQRESQNIIKKYYNIPMPVIVITGAGNNIENMLRIVVIVAKGFLL